METEGKDLFGLLQVMSRNLLHLCLNHKPQPLKGTRSQPTETRRQSSLTEAAAITSGEEGLASVKSRNARMGGDTRCFKVCYQMKEGLQALWLAQLVPAAGMGL